MTDKTTTNPDRPKTIFRVKKSGENPYVMLDKRPIYQSDLSWRAKGIWAYLMSKPDHWQTNVQDIVNHGPEGKHAVRTALKELRQAGYLKKYQVREDSGQFGQFIWLVFEIAQTPDTEAEDKEPPVYIEPESENQTAVQPESDLPQAVKPDSGQSDTSNKELSIKKEFKVRDLRPPWENNGHHREYNPKNLEKNNGPVQAWMIFKNNAKSEMPLATYNQWIHPLWIDDVVDGVFIIGAPSKLHADWATQRVLQSALNYFKGISPYDKTGVEIRHIKE